MPPLLFNNKSYIIKFTTRHAWSSSCKMINKVSITPPTQPLNYLLFAWGVENSRLIWYTARCLSGTRAGLACMREWMWRGFRFSLPVDWELLQFSRERGIGRCAFADRYQYRLEWSWRAVERMPDIARLMTDYRSKLVTEGTMAEPKLVELAGWRGLAGKQGKAWTSRFGRFFEEAGCLTELVFLWPGSRNHEIERSVCSSFEPVATKKGLQPWKAFGMAIEAPAQVPLFECKVEPANAVLTFSAKKGGDSCVFRRLGLAPVWLKEPVADWLRRQMPRRVRDVACTEETRAGHSVSLVRGTVPRRGPFFPPRSYAAAAWQCPDDGRLYCVTQTERKRKEPCAPPPTLSCCSGCEVQL